MSGFEVLAAAAASVTADDVEAERLTAALVVQLRALLAHEGPSVGRIFAALDRLRSEENGVLVLFCLRATINMIEAGQVLAGVPLVSRACAEAAADFQDFAKALGPHR
jgi:predicted exporter